MVESVASSPSNMTALAISAHRMAWTSRRPPRPSFRSGSSRNATSPASAWREATRLLISASHRLARLRHNPSPLAARSSVSPMSPARWRIVTSEVAVSRSLAAKPSASLGVRTE